MRDVDIAYCAGLIDGEGHVAVVNQKKYGYIYPTPMIAVQMTDFNAIEFLQQTFGQGSVCFPKTAERHHLQTARWAVASRKAYFVAKLIEPYLLVKKQAGQAIIAHYDAPKPEDKPNRYSRGESHYAAKLTSEQVQEIRAAGLARRKYGDAKKLAEKYGVNASTLHRIWSGKHWAGWCS